MPYFRNYLTVATLLFASSYARADAWYELIRYRCDQKNDVVEVAYVGGYNEEGERLMQNKSENEWNPWDLIEGDNGSESRYIKAIESVRKQCKLSDGVYTVEMSPSPCNYDVQGMNGGMMTANATIRRGKKILAKQSLGACDVGEELIATKVSVHAGSNVPAIEKKKAGDYYQ